MKRLLPVVLVLCLLFCGCRLGTPEPTQPATEPTQAPTQAATESSTEPTTEPTQAQSEKVTVYLVERSSYLDSGHIEYHYDEDYNIDYYEFFTMENDLLFTCYFEQKDGNGMGCKFRTLWPGGMDSEDWTLTWFQDGKIKEAQLDGGYTGYQYEYDLKGDVIEKRAYYEGMLEYTVFYEYNGSELCRVYCEGSEGNHHYDCRVENGLIIEKAFADPEIDYSHFYEYDENGNWIMESVLYDGELTPSQVHTYKAVEVDADRAHYLLAQQNYLLSIT